MKRSAALAVLAAASLGLSACGSSSQSQNAAEQSSSPAAAPTGAMPTGAMPTGKPTGSAAPGMSTAKKLPDFSSWKFLQGGSWTCSQQLYGSTVTDTMTWDKELNGAYLTAHDVLKPPSGVGGNAIDTTISLTYNSRTKQWIWFWRDSTAFYEVASSSGWQGNRMTMKTSFASDGTSAVNVWEKKSDNKFVNHFTEKDASGKTTVDVPVTCTRS
ncbi:hypothetical protein ACFWPQ_38020 [Streptomyces sp. NPDC058464]|uniref:hypothetical protein n=1 Tax=Streptomyces sp. NPDC058464 TaxID=3346511 RepID=UPI003664613B